MRIRKSRSRQLTREDTVRFLTGTVREAVGSHTMDLTMDEREAIEIIEEMGYDYDNHIAHMENQVAINDALAGYPDLVTYEVIESAVKKEMANRANRPPAPDPAMLDILYDVTPADPMEGWDEDPGLWAAVEVDYWSDDGVALLWAGSPAGWIEFGVADEDIEWAGPTGDKFYQWMEQQGAKVRRKSGAAPKKLLHMLSMG